MLEADEAARSTLRTARRIDLLVALTASDLRARYGRGAWKSLKWLLDPFFATGVYLILVTFVIDRPGEAPGLSIACATVPFQLVIASVVNGLGSVQLRHSIVLNTRFDRTLIPLSGVVAQVNGDDSVPADSKMSCKIDACTPEASASGSCRPLLPC